MSLQVWLPLTKDLRNQGLSNVIVTNNGATTDSTGKLGGCYSFVGAKYCLFDNPIISNGDFSICAWVYPTSTNSSYLYVSRAAASDGYGIFIALYGTSVRFSDGSLWNATVDLSTVNTWYHLCFTKSSSKKSVYINGILAASTTTVGDLSHVGTQGCIGTNYYDNRGSVANNSYIKVNDFRIYDHCLSPMEVKELAKGLVLHYPLNRQGWGQENLASQYIMPGGNNPGSTATAGRTNYYGDYGITIPATENADTYFSIWYSEPLESGAVYTLSAEVSGLIGNSYYNFPLFAQNNTSMGSIKFDHNGLNTLTFTMNYTGTIATATVNGKTYYRMFMDDNGRTIASGQGAITIKNIKLEKGSIATPWCPNSSDTLATTMGLNSTTEYDCSGFCNNGTRTGTFTWTSDTPKYAVSTNFSTISQHIYLNYDTNGFKDSYSIGLWLKYNSTQTNTAPEIFGIPAYACLFISGNLIYWNTNDGTNNPFKNNGSTLSITPYVDNWHHFVITGNGTNVILYIDGVEAGRATTYKHFGGTKIVLSDKDNTRNTFSFIGLASDFRIYATALSASDVKSLYQNSAYIDSSGNVYGAIHSEI